MTALTDLPEWAAAALERFASGPAVSDRATALTDLLNQKALSRAVRTEPFRVGFDGLVQCLGPVGDPETQLTALAQLTCLPVWHGQIFALPCEAVPQVFKELQPFCTAELEERSKFRVHGSKHTRRAGWKPSRSKAFETIEVKLALEVE